MSARRRSLLSLASVGDPRRRKVLAFVQYCRSTMCAYTLPHNTRRISNSFDLTFSSEGRKSHARVRTSTRQPRTPVPFPPCLSWEQEEREKLRGQLKEKTAALHKAKERQSELSVLSRDRRLKEESMRGLETEIMKMKKIKVCHSNP